MNINYGCIFTKDGLSKGIVSFLMVLALTASAAPRPIEESWQQQIQSLAEQINFSEIKQDKAALKTFFAGFPKGANLHHHYSGSIFPDESIDEAIAKHLCLDIDGSTLVKCKEGLTSVANATKTLEGQVSLEKAWSVTDLETPLDDRKTKFFNLFKQLGLLFGFLEPGFLATTRQHAAWNQVSHLETMTFTADTNELKTLVPKGIIPDPDNVNSLKLFHDHLVSQNSYQSLLKNTLESISTVAADSEEQLKCDTNNPDPACDVSLAFIAISNRNHPLDQLFVELIFSFDLAQRSLISSNPLVTGINLVGLESQLSSVDQYNHQMQLIAYLKQHPDYPLVSKHISLHAGEFSLKDSPYSILSTGLTDTIDTVMPARIGHGVSINWQLRENNITHHMDEASYTTAQKMAAAPVAVEIPLTSNEVLLDIDPAQHPLMFYKNANVPVTLATDDPGILRTTMSEEFYKAAVGFPDLTLLDFIEFARNSLEYSFKAGNSLWTATSSYPRFIQLVSECTTLTSQECLNYLEKNPKARLQQQLELNLQAFLQLQLKHFQPESHHSQL